ncbi:MAG: glycosyltransferase family 9 protein, partial [Planctomycetota bacterium]|nr:glycosyltransferase family 9 protein [Planctomycetota bacterium]
YIRDCRGILLTHGVRPSREILEAHQSWYYLNLLRETLGLRMPDPAVRRELPEGAKLLPSGEWGDGCVELPPVELPVAADDVAAMRDFLDRSRNRKGTPLIALAPGAAYGPAKRWPADRYAALADIVWDEMGGEAVIVGAPSEIAQAEDVGRLCRRPFLQAAGRTSAGQLAALLSLCAGFAGNDSGAMHVAGALGIPTVGIFGSTRCDRTAPLGPRVALVYRRVGCSPCMERECRFGHMACFKSIGPDEVFDVLKRQMAGCPSGTGEAEDMRTPAGLEGTPGRQDIPPNPGRGGAGATPAGRLPAAGEAGSNAGPESNGGGRAP